MAAPPPTPEPSPNLAEADVLAASGTSLEEPLHPLDAHAVRAPVPKTAGIWAIVLTEDEAKAEAVAERLRQLLSGRGRPLRIIVEPYKYESRAVRLKRALQGADLPLVLVTTAMEPWTEAHLNPLLKAIDHADHVLGRRRRSFLGRVVRWLACRPWAFLFAIPLRDVHSPCRLHRREALEVLPPQSSSRFLDVELLAKASFFVQLVDEEDVPPMPDAPGPAGFWGDFLEVFLHPVIRFESEPAPDPKPEPAPDSVPAEDPQGDDEGDNRPGSEDKEVRADVHQARPFEDHAP
ncbi:hypothetical protein [Tautonia rosea]|uniref:hypothetical protein n=1 Tax=Tautonia rosea TaxID=2728037 RepID=UPI001475C30E|nr:hypothetical protein [Tautonia rosea]